MFYQDRLIEYVGEWLNDEWNGSGEVVMEDNNNEIL